MKYEDIEIGKYYVLKVNKFLNPSSYKNKEIVVRVLRNSLVMIGMFLCDGENYTFFGTPKDFIRKATKEEVLMEMLE